MSFNFKNFIFDLDGTIINSSDEVLSCFKMAFKKANFRVNEERFTSDVIGPPLREILKKLAPDITDIDLEIIITHFREIYDNDTNDISVIYDGVYETLDSLKQDKCRLFMATFKPKKPTLRIIEQFNLSYFEDIYTVDKFDHPITKEEMIKEIIQKYNLKNEETVMVGDAISDIKAAHANNIKAVGALYGYGDDKTPLIQNADILIENMGELCQK